MATDQATESLPDQYAENPRVDVVANELRMSVDVLLALLRNQRLYLNPGDRAPRQVVFDALQRELDEGRAWLAERLVRA